MLESPSNLSGKAGQLHLSGSTQVQQYTYAFNADGDRTSRTDQNNTITSYGYDQADRLTSVGNNIQYTYDGAGLRVSKSVAGQSEPFVWDHADGLPLILQDGSTSYVTGPGGLPLEQISASGNPLYYQHDQLGSTRLITDVGANVVASYTYDSYGNVTSPPPTITNPFQFAGGYADSESSLLYMRARYYDPASGSFLTKDPLSATEPYSYAADSPLNLVDPSGLAPGFRGWVEDQIQLVPERAFGFTDSLFFGPEQALQDGNCLGFAAGIAAFFLPFGPEFKAGAGEAEDVIAETFAGSGNFRSIFTLRSEEALQAGEDFLGPGYQELGKVGSGVFRSADKLRQFRIDSRSLQGLHPPRMPHVHFELFNPGDVLPYVNNHVPFHD